MRTLCLGEALVDLVCHEPAAGLAQAPSFVPHHGGATANVAVACVRHGGRAALAGGAGADGWGQWLRERLEREGVDLTWFSLVEGAQTPIAFVTVDEQAQPTFSIYGEGIATGIRSVADRIDEAVEACDALFLASNTLVGEDERELTLGAHAKALELGRPVLLDPNLRIARWPSAARAVEETRPLVKGAFLVKCNATEAHLLTGERDPDAAARAMLAGGARHVVVTLGQDGALLRGGKLDRDVPGRVARAVDTTGAGDAFMGVLLARLSASGFYAPAIAAALRDAVDVAARTTEHWGALG
ncbi:carbohydrate kinase family protein [Conexibacter sp. SYSU D00693]|uniref:carbohydrate kinase family protein n=1 Tax=Conexibacter sp. SYSU D00693 TaxID=2812560 RepID=UPI00196B76FF|nr:PfkB family carbohydrate kinase [Conexibacter sp. SYSU D00693]